MQLFTEKKNLKIDVSRHLIKMLQSLRLFLLIYRIKNKYLKIFIQLKKNKNNLFISINFILLLILVII